MALAGARGTAISSIENANLRGRTRNAGGASALMCVVLECREDSLPVSDLDGVRSRPFPSECPPNQPDESVSTARPVPLFYLCLSLAPLCLCAGCLNCWTTRLPTCWTRGPEIERREAQIQDPFPDSKWGPDTGFRPLEFQQQRSEPQRAKDRHYTSMLRTRFGVSPAPPLPPPGPGTYHAPAPHYPGAVW